jgi:hypothetical protein
MTNTPVILSYGLGVDSTAILLRWITEPSSRDFELSDLIVLTAMTGDEWDFTGQAVEDHILPLMREHGIRYIQIARGGATKDQGITVLSDTNAPTQLFLKGDWKLSDELLTSATVPQSGNNRLCSIKAKGEPLDATIARILGADTKFRHVMGFEAEEGKRAKEDTEKGNSAVRTGEYPLIAWGWDRAKCEEFIFSVTGVKWEKSACVFCPFAFNGKKNSCGVTSTERILGMYRQYPEAAAHALFVEHVSLLFNENQPLLTSGKSLRDRIVEDGNQAALDALEAKLDATPHAIYHLRRIGTRWEKNGKTGYRWLRSITRVSEPELADAEARSMVEVVRPRTEGEVPVKVEEFYVVAPATVADKHNVGTKAQYDAKWAEAIA